MAKRFVFRLENVLNVRKRKEEGIELAFAKKKAELLQAERELTSMKEKLHRFMRENRYSEGTFTVFDILAVDNYIVRVEHDLKQLEELRVSRETEANRVLSSLVEAKKARKVIENLKERQLGLHREMMDREENIELDDINQSISLNKEVLTIEDALMEDM